MPLPDASKLAIELCEKLGILYHLGTGDATLCGIPMSELPESEPFKENENYVAYCHIETKTDKVPRIQYKSDIHTDKGVILSSRNETYTVNPFESSCLVA